MTFCAGVSQPGLFDRGPARVCPRCGAAVGPPSCNACLRAWNGRGAWLVSYWLRYFGNGR